MPYRSNEEVRREFREHIGNVPEHAKYIIDKYTKDACCIMCGHPAQPGTVVNKLENLIIDGRLSDLDAIIEGLPEERQNEHEVYTSIEAMDSAYDMQKGYNSCLSDIKSYIISLKG